MRPRLANALPTLLAVGCVIVPARAETLRVGGPGGLPTISRALEIASPGDTIVVASGEYHENLIIDKTVSLVGEGRPHVRGLGEGDVVRVMGDDVEMRGFSVSGSGGPVTHEIVLDDPLDASALQRAIEAAASPEELVRSLPDPLCRRVACPVARPLLDPNPHLEGDDRHAR